MSEPEGFTRVTLTEWRVVNTDGGGIAFSTTSRDNRWPEDGMAAAEEWQRICSQRAPHHIEVWEQTYLVGPTERRRIS